VTPEIGARPIVAVFARAPVLGQVKTRLARTLGDAAALDVHRMLLDRTLGIVADVGEVDAELWLDGARDLLPACALPVFAQSDGDLGARMLAVIEDIAARGRPAIVIGCDCPVLDADYVRAARDALAHGADVVIGPVEDGGYILIGMREPIPRLLLDMTWSTERVCAETLARADALGLRTSVLARLWDIDDAADLDRWKALQASATPDRKSSQSWK
jgi:uncharacterized protein